MAGAKNILDSAAKQTAVIKSSPLPAANREIELAEHGAMRITSLHFANSI